MKKTEETKPAFSCEFCNRNFIREKTLVTHICETKHRWLEKDKQSNRMGFQSFLQFYKKHSASKKVKTYEEFIKSAYYIAFVKFGTYCVGSNVLNTNYTKYLIDYLRKEDAFDAIHRSVESTIDWAEKDNILPKDYLRYGNMNRVCQLICNGKISPWLLYCSESGVRFLETLNPDHVKIINDYINPEQWALKFHREPELQNRIKDTLKQAGY